MPLIRSAAKKDRRVSGRLGVWPIGRGQPPGGAFVALVPGAEAPLIALTLPPALRGVAREDVARRQVVDRLGVPTASLEIRPLRLGKDDRWNRVAIADRALVLKWRAQLGAAAARCRGLLPDYLALPAAPGLWVVDLDAEGMRVRLGPGDGFSAETDLGWAMLRIALDRARATQRLPVAILLTGGEAPAGIFDAITQARAIADLPATLQPGVLSAGEMSVDFARDSRADADGIARQIRRLLPPLGLVALGAAGWAVAQGLAARQDRAAAVAIGDQTLAAVRRDLLPNGPILDLRAQVARAIEQRRTAAGSAAGSAAAGSGPLDLLRAASEALASVAARVETIGFAPGVEGITARLHLADFQALDAATGAISAAGLGVRVTRSSTEPGGGVSAQLQITEGGR